MKNKRIVGLFVIIGIGVLVSFLWTRSCSDAIGSRQFDRSAKQFLARQEKIAHAAKSFSQTKALDALGANTINGFTYRLDDHFDTANVERAAVSDVVNDEDLTLFRADFAPDAPNVLTAPAQGDGVAISNGIATLRITKNVPVPYIETPDNVSVPMDEVGEVLIRARATAPVDLVLGWSKHPVSFSATREAEKRERKFIFGHSRVYLAPDKSFRIYKLKGTSALRGLKHLRPGDVIQRIFVSLEGQTAVGTKVEVDDVSFIRRGAAYTREEAGVAYEKRDRELRPVIYAASAVTMSWHLTLPAGKPVFAFGLARLDDRSSMTFSVTVEEQNMPASFEEIFKRTIATHTAWEDASVDLSAWAGKSIRLTLKTSSTERNIGFWSNPVVRGAPQKRFNVLLLLEDALRADHLSAYGYAVHPTSPMKASWIKGGVRFTHAFSQATNTRPSCPSFMTSLYPTATGIRHQGDVLDDRYLTLAEIFRHQGFVTASFLQNANAGSAAGLHQGFSYLRDQGERGRAENLYVNRLHAFLNKHGRQNFFLYLHVRDPHGPYDPEPEYDEWYQLWRKAQEGTAVEPHHVDPEWLKTPTIEARRHLYDGEIRQNDALFPAVLRELRGRHLLRDTLIVFIADHGEHLGEHGLWAHKPPAYRQVLHVPLMMAYSQRLPRGMVIDTPVQLLDMMPTILEIAGIPTAPLLIQGDSLMPLIDGKSDSSWRDRLIVSDEAVSQPRGRKYINRGALFIGRWHVLRSAFSEDEQDLETRVFDYIADPNGFDPLPAGSEPEYQERIANFLTAYLAYNSSILEQMTGETRKSADVVIDVDIQRRLRALGYVQ